MPNNNSVTKEDRIWEFSRTATFALFAIVLVVSLVILRPAAPDSITLLTGPEGGTYHEFGKRYAASLEDLGLEVDVKVTAGGFENVVLLAAGADDTVAFAPSNIELVIDDSVDTSDLVSMGSIAYEPLWLFYRADLAVRRIPDLAGLRVATGTSGTVVDHVARSLFELNGVTDQVRIQPSEGQSPETVAKNLIEGEIDAAFAIGRPASPIIKDLLGDDDLEVLSFERADAYQALDPGITQLVAPEGVLDLDQARGLFQTPGKGGEGPRRRRGIAAAPRRIGRTRPSQRDDLRAALEPPDLHRFQTVSPRHARPGLAGSDPREARSPNRGSSRRLIITADGGNTTVKNHGHHLKVQRSLATN